MQYELHAQLHTNMANITGLISSQKNKLKIPTVCHNHALSLPLPRQTAVSPSHHHHHHHHRVARQPMHFCGIIVRTRLGYDETKPILWPAIIKGTVEADDPCSRATVGSPPPKFRLQEAQQTRMRPLWWRMRSAYICLWNVSLIV